MSAPEIRATHYDRHRLPRGVTGSAQSGTIAAGLAADAFIWTYRYPENAGEHRVLAIQRILSWTINIVAFGTAITAGRGLVLVKGAPTSGTADNPSGGNAFTPVRNRSDTSEATGVGRIADTGALTVTGYTFGEPIRQHNLSNIGTAGNGLLRDWQFDQLSDPLILLPGELVGIKARQLFDATGTFVFTSEVDAVEVDTKDLRGYMGGST